jgi:hypothetical protein
VFFKRRSDGASQGTAAPVGNGVSERCPRLLWRLQTFVGGTPTWRGVQAGDARSSGSSNLVRPRGYQPFGAYEPRFPAVALGSELLSLFAGRSFALNMGRASFIDAKECRRVLQL